MACRLGIYRSIQLSYGRKYFYDIYQLPPPPPPPPPPDEPLPPDPELNPGTLRDDEIAELEILELKELLKLGVNFKN